MLYSFPCIAAVPVVAARLCRGSVFRLPTKPTGGGVHHNLDENVGQILFLRPLLEVGADRRPCRTPSASIADRASAGRAHRSRATGPCDSRAAPEPARNVGHRECQKRLRPLGRDVLAKPGEVALSLSRQELDQVIFACEGLMVTTQALEKIFAFDQATEQEAQLMVPMSSWCPSYGRSSTACARCGHEPQAGQAQSRARSRSSRWTPPRRRPRRLWLPSQREDE